MKLQTAVAFILFAALIAFRDIIYGKYLSEVIAPSLFSFIISATISAIALIIILFKRKFNSLIVKLKNPEIRNRSIVLGIIAAIIYLITFFCVKEIGAGYFNLIDYGLAPILTSLLGIVYFKDVVNKSIYFSFSLYLLGLYLLIYQFDNIHTKELIYLYIGIALLSPIGSSLSDFFTKWLLDIDKGNLDREELLLVRFLPATVVLCFVIWFDPQVNCRSLTNQDLIRSIICSMFFGFLPLYLLCFGLVNTALSKYAIFEFLIPLLAFILTIDSEDTNLVTKSIGAFLILVGIVIGQVKFKFKDKPYDKKSA